MFLETVNVSVPLWDFCVDNDQEYHSGREFLWGSHCMSHLTRRVWTLSALAFGPSIVCSYLSRWRFNSSPPHHSFLVSDSFRPWTSPSNIHALTDRDGNATSPLPTHLTYSLLSILTHGLKSKGQISNTPGSSKFLKQIKKNRVYIFR